MGASQQVLYLDLLGDLGLRGGLGDLMWGSWLETLARLCIISACLSVPSEARKHVGGPPLEPHTQAVC